MPGFDPVIFDLDGTVVDTVELIRRSFRHAARAVLGTEPSDRQLMAGVGQPLMTQMILLSPEHARELYDTYREYNHAHHDELIRAYDGIEAVLRQLRAAGKRLGLVTSKGADTTRMAFDAVAVGHLFDAVVTADDTTEHKPSPVPIRLCLERLGAAGRPPGTPAAGRPSVAPAVGRPYAPSAGMPSGSMPAIYVGDSPVDIAAGTAAGLATAAVTWGIFSLDDLLAAGPTFVLDEPREIVDLCLTGLPPRRKPRA